MIQEGGLKSFSEIGIVKIFYNTLGVIIGKTGFSKKAMDVNVDSIGL